MFKHYLNFSYGLFIPFGIFAVYVIILPKTDRYPNAKRSCPRGKYLHSSCGTHFLFISCFRNIVSKIRGSYYVILKLKMKILSRSFLVINCASGCNFFSSILLSTYLAKTILVLRAYEARNHQSGSASRNVQAAPFLSASVSHKS